MARVLLVDDERDFRSAVAFVLRSARHVVFECASAAEAMAEVERESFDVVLADLRMPGGSGLEVLRAASSRSPGSILVVLTAYGSLESAIDALRIGVHDFVLKPVNLQALVRKVDLLVEHQALLAENQVLRRSTGGVESTAEIVGSSPAMTRLRELVNRVAATESTVLVTGETGTGKELAARAIHEASVARDRPFVAVNCGSIPETLLESELFGHVRGAFTSADRDKKGLFEVAGSGTFFLDEIGELPPGLQVKILRALESREIRRVGSTTVLSVSARVIAATHRDLGRMMKADQFRSDLYYRLNVVEVRMPSLREHVEDIPEIASRVLVRHCRRMNRQVPSLAGDALARLARYSWPGNVRELANLLERALILSSANELTAADFPNLAAGPERVESDDLRLARQTFERAHVRRIVEKFGGDKRLAAQALGIDLSSLYRKLEA